MLFRDIAIVNENFEIAEHMYVGVKDKFIEYISSKPPLEDFGEIYNGNGKLLIPAFYNAHSHLPMCLMRGYGESLSLMDWLNKRIFPFEDLLTQDDIQNACLLGIAEMLRFGIVGTTEMYMKGDAMGKAFAQSGVKANLSVGCVHTGDLDYYALPAYKETLAMKEKFDGFDGGRLRTDFSLHAEYTSNERIASALARAAADNGSSIHVHVSETAGEVEDCKSRHGGRSPVKYLEDCGIFSVPCVAAHCVHIDDEDISILKKHDVSVATCPKSNAKLASGFCPVSMLLDAGVNVAIGTDSVASNNNLNMIEEMRFLSLIQKGRFLDPTLITPAQTLYAATRAGAIAGGRNDCGMIKQGFRADLTVIDIDKIYMKPVHNLLNNLIFSASGSDVVMTMADGAVLYRDGTFPTLDIEKITYTAQKSCNRITKKL